MEIHDWYSHCGLSHNYCNCLAWFLATAYCSSESPPLYSNCVFASFYCTCFAVEGLSSRNPGLYSCQVLHDCIVFVLLVFRVLNASAVEIHDYVTTFPAYWFFNGLLFVLQILHLMWTYLILRIAYQKVQTGSVSRIICVHFLIPL